MQSNLSSNFIPFHITRKLFASKIFSYEYAKKKYNKRNKCCKTIILPFTKQISFAQQIFFIKKKSKTFCYSHPLVDPRSFISSKKKFFRNRETSNLSTHDTRASRNSKSLVMSLVKKPYRFTHDTEEENRQSAVGDDRFVRHDTGISNR